MLSYCGHRFCHKFIALSLPCTVTFVDKEEGRQIMDFCYAKSFSGAFGAEYVWKSCWQGGGSTHPPRHPPPQGRPRSPKTVQSAGEEGKENRERIFVFC